MKYKSLTLLLALLFSAFLVLKPTLQGGFIFDDEHSLSKLQYINDEVNSERLWYYLGHSDTGPLKRPISVFSFVLDAQNWPAEAYPFKRTNLLIHLLNGALLFALLMTFLKTTNHRIYLALFISGFWLLHPFLISTTAYVVQRMTMLSTGFILLSILCYAQCRWHDQHRWLLLILVSGLAFSVLSKENGVLLLLLLPLTEYLICRNYWEKPQLPKRIYMMVVVAPVLLFLIVFFIQLMDLSSGYQLREFNWHERLLTQFRMLVKYLYHWFIPYYFTEGVFGDGIRHSESLFNPISTLSSFILVSLMMYVAWLSRLRYPLLSFSLAFFFTAHLIESTVFPLELYFEHRNYLAAPFLVLFVVHLADRISNKKWFWILTGLLFLHLTIQSSLRAELWSDNFQLHKKTMDRYPESVRATMYTANFYEWQGQPLQALRILTDAHAQGPQLQYVVYKEFITCKWQGLSIKQNDEVVRAIQSLGVKKDDFRPLGYLIYALIENKCGTDGNLEKAEDIIIILAKTLGNESVMGKSFIAFAMGRIQFERQEYISAADNFLLALTEEQDYLSFVHSVSRFLVQGQPEIAKNMLIQSMRQYDRDFIYKPDFLNVRKELEYFLKLAEEDINSLP